MADYRIARRIGAIGAAAGAAAWVVTLRADLVLTHYDAKAHLVVARRVIDNITPGWQQIGAVWLPLPHLIQLVPTQIDLFYRTGVFGSLVSVTCFGVTAYAAARLALATTGSVASAVAAVALLVLNPNLLYLQATPMTEPLLLAVSFLAVLWLYEWLVSGAAAVPRRLGWLLFAAAWTRYEAWPILVASLAAAGYAMWRRGVPGPIVVRRLSALSVWPAAAVAAFLILSRVTIGAWFVAGGFYEPDPTYEGDVPKSLLAVWWGTHELSGYVVEIVGLGAAATYAVRGLMRAGDSPLLVPLALFTPAVLPVFAFVSGHPFRIRYMVPLVAACALFAGLSIALLRVRGGRPLAATALAASLAIESPLWDGSAPLIAEAQWDVPISLNRRAVTQCLASEYRGEKVVASMASLAHYMQELSQSGFDIADFVHEGNGVIWNAVFEMGAAAHAGWMLVEEQSEGGDVLAQTIRRRPGFAYGMTRVCEGGGVALYKRAPDFRLPAPGQP